MKSFDLVIFVIIIGWACFSPQILALWNQTPKQKTLVAQVRLNIVIIWIGVE